jgi:uncharacterized damage-inducible protein DinB
VRRAKVYGRSERRTGIVPFERLVDEVTKQEPYRSAPRVFWVMNNGSSHRGQRCAARMRTRWPSIIVVHTPVPASWLNQVQVYFSIVQRKVLTPTDFRSLAELEDRLLRFQEHYAATARAFEWKLTRDDLRRHLATMRAHEGAAAAIAAAA